MLVEDRRWVLAVAASFCSWVWRRTRLFGGVKGGGGGSRERGGLGFAWDDTWVGGIHWMEL